MFNNELQTLDKMTLQLKTKAFFYYLCKKNTFRL